MICALFLFTFTMVEIFEHIHGSGKLKIRIKKMIELFNGNNTTLNLKPE